MSNEKKSLSQSLRDALAKKHAAQHPDAKNATASGKGPTPRGAGSAQGKPMRKAAARGR